MPASQVAINKEINSSKPSGDTALATGNVQTTNPGSSMSLPAKKSIYVSNLPPEADSLWVYERLAVTKPVRKEQFLPSSRHLRHLLLQ